MSKEQSLRCSTCGKKVIYTEDVICDDSFQHNDNLHRQGTLYICKSGHQIVKPGERTASFLRATTPPARKELGL